MISPLTETGILSSCTKAFVERNSALESLIGKEHNYFSIEKAIQAKAQFNKSKRQILVEALKTQYRAYLGNAIQDKHLSLIESLNDSNTYTVTTGQQLHIGIGPVFVLYKIIAIIQLCHQLNRQYPDKRFIPVYWMASEDHDIDEIKDLKLFGKKHSWQTSQKGASGRLSVEGLDKVFDEMINAYQFSDEQLHWINRFKSIYSESNQLSEATFKCLLSVFENDNFICIDADNKQLKSLAIPMFKTDILEQKNESIFNAMTKSMHEIGFNKQLHARAINCFYLQDQSRERIERTSDGYATVDHSKQWTSEAIEKEIELFPERFSPNAVLRPLYQECILPNVVYMGGNAEVHYWIQLAHLFESNQIAAPCLRLRPSIWIGPNKVLHWLKEKQISPFSLIKNQNLEHLKIQLGGSANPIQAIRQTFKSLKQSTQDESAKFNVQGLKALVELGKQYEKQLHNLEQSVQIELDNRIDFDLKKLQDIQQKYFSHEQPQERHLSSLEFLLNYSISTILKIKLSEISPENAYIFEV